jgi:GNAT superfamily N-acetyltransferase
MPEARHATRADVPALAQALARAFRTDPVWRWMVPSDERWQAHATRVFDAELRNRLKAGHTYTTDDLAGAAVWAPPGFWRGPLTDLLRAVPATAALIGPKVVRGLGLLHAMDKAHPRNEHWYLAVLGTDPDQQGRGVGASVLAPVLDRCDRDGAGAYLESSNPANVPFYERHGFRVTGQIRAGDRPPLDSMWREPASDRGSPSSTSTA